MDEKALTEHACGYLKELYAGVDPIDKTPVTADSILKDQRLGRCLEYVIGVFGRISESDNISRGDYRIRFSPDVKREPEVLRRAEYIFRKLSEGIDPFTDKKLDSSDTVRKQRLSKCFGYTAYVLSSTVLTKSPFSVDENLIESSVYSDDEITLPSFVEKLNAPIDGEKMNRIDNSMVIAYLASIMLVSISGGVASPTRMGAQLGLSLGDTGEIMLNRTMQKLIVKNLEAISKKAEGK